MGATTRRRWLASEVIQTSAMDCGPASLKCLLDGFGIRVNYARLREACQTDVDGTSIDTLEQIARQFGLDAEQVMLPPEDLFLAEAQALPALVVTMQPGGATHFVVAWRAYGGLVQVMDPGCGRRWLTSRAFLADVYRHRLRVSANDWKEYAASDEARSMLARRCDGLGVGRATRDWLITDALLHSNWQRAARFDAALRLTTSMVHNKVLKRGLQAGSFLIGLCQRQSEIAPGERDPIPDTCWSARPSTDTTEGSAGDTQIVLHGAVLIRVRGRLDLPRGESHAVGAAEAATSPESGTAEGSLGTELPTQLADVPPPSAQRPFSPELAAQLADKPIRPIRELLRFLRPEGRGFIAMVAAASLLAAATLVLEALLIRSAFGLGHALRLLPQRLSALAAFEIFALATLALELQVNGALLRAGRGLEIRMRMTILDRLAGLLDKYFRTRPVSDLAERGHTLHQLRQVPQIAGRGLRVAATLVFTVAAIAWLDRPGAPLAILAVALAIGVPLAARPRVQELDLRERTHSGSLVRFMLDALLGLTAVRAHAAETALRREQESLLCDWARAGIALVRTNVAVDALQALTGYGLAVMLLYRYATAGGEPGGALLIAYWALTIPALGEETGLFLRRWPILRNLTLRALEPLSAHPPPDQTADPTAPTRTHVPAAVRMRTDAPAAPAVTVAYRSVAVELAGHTLVHDIDLTANAGEELAIVGASGSGKSTLVSVLLGWQTATSGQVLIDGEPLHASQLDRLHASTAWVDPSVYLWNRTLLDNLTFGLEEPSSAQVGAALGTADLHGVLGRLPDGLQTPLGEGGGLVSGGEGQRVRLGRALLRPNPRLVILDEAFRGLERDSRLTLLRRVRQHWKGATLLCITHDVQDALEFDRVIVMRDGTIVEDGVPDVLAADPQSAYRALLASAQTVHRRYWGHGAWRRVRMEGGVLRAVAHQHADR
jgi:ABC-type bacteriocin/lantibiotic exporter with double-glycine peptidase domain